MEFRSLIQVLERTFGDKGFSSKNVLQALHVASLTDSQSGIGGYLRSAFPKLKMVSKDLDRLYRMGFVYRKKQNRQAKTKTGKICNKGFEYRYWLTPNGHSYVRNYLWNPHPERRRESLDHIDLVLHEYAKRKASSPEQAEANWAYHKTLYPSDNQRPIAKRFPVKRDPVIIELLMRTIRERDEFRAQLPELRKEIEALKSRSWL